MYIKVDIQYEIQDVCKIWTPLKKSAMFFAGLPRNLRLGVMKHLSVSKIKEMYQMIGESPSTTYRDIVLSVSGLEQQWKNLTEPQISVFGETDWELALSLIDKIGDNNFRSMSIQDQILWASSHNLKSLIALLTTTQSKEPPVHAIYYRDGPHKILMLLKPRSKEVVYTPYGIESLKINPVRLPSYTEATILFHKYGDDLVSIPYKKGRSSDEISELIAKVPLSQSHSIVDLPSGPFYEGRYGKSLPVEKALQSLDTCQSDMSIHLNASYRGGIFYEKMPPLVGPTSGVSILSPGMMIMGKNNDYVIDSSYNFDQVMEDISKCGRVHYMITSIYGLLDISDPNARVGHALAMSIDPETHILELIDPNGITPNTRHIYY
jgi:hypothetical protein